jgi:site-specific DNA-methyltransferase (adenine-specific)
MIDLRLGDCLEVLKTLEDNSVDSIVTDPPYGLSFMNKKWDYDVPSVEIWKECLRVLKPGGHLLSFGGSRTYHRMAVAIEDAGFEVRDQIMWVYGSGFPKSHNIGKAIDKMGIDSDEYKSLGSALKPAHEPICMARKPLSKKSIAENVLKWGTGGINIDDCRIGFSENDDPRINKGYEWESKAEPFGEANSTQIKEGWNSEGRFPANIMFDNDSDEDWKRYFYCPKVSKKERGDGNIHPTVKPIKLMEYLITLVTPKGGVVLEPFMGSGSTGIAAKNLGMSFIGIEKEEEYFEIAKQRINKN